MIGIFGVSEALVQIHDIHIQPMKQNVKNIIPSWALLWKHTPLIIKSALIGIGIGALPGAGGDIAALMAYGSARRSIKNPTRPFGQGAYEGVIAPETANNACIGGDNIPMITLGIPGDAVTAILIGALYIHGLKPGPMLMIDTPHLFWFWVGALTLANTFLLPLGLTGIKIFAKCVEVRKGLLLPIIIIISTVGTYAIQNSLSDVYWMLGFGTFGYVLKMYGFQMGPVILGVILGPIMEEGFRRTMQDSLDSIPAALWGFASHPLSVVLIAITVAMLGSQYNWWERIKKALAKK
jgi:putative tricarboxylic transport membrane protein